MQRALLSPSSHPRGLLVAGTRSGCGKTSVALGLMRALARRGLRVQAFKAGPDFIDPGHHALATGEPSHNLDDWMCGAAGTREVFARHAAGADVAVVEGVMGLFDGYAATDAAGSSASLARLLGLPVLLVADAASMARSAAAMVGGYLSFEPDLRFCGVVLNNAGSESHAALLREVMAGCLPGTRLWGVLPRRSELAMPSRHLGLVTAGDDAGATARLESLADWIESSLDVDALMRSLPPIPLSGGPGGDDPPRQGSPEGAAPPLAAGGSPRLGVARDAAFCFYYAENLRLFEAAGMELVPFSPLTDGALPEGLDGLYFGGGYPELHAAALAANAGMLAGVRAFCASGRPVLAECGGFMYLMASLADLSGNEHAMTGVFPFRAAMSERFSALGYRQVTTLTDTLLGPAGTRLRGHEFHYSRILGETGDVPGVYAAAGRKGELPGRHGFLRGGTLGSYVHLHFASCPQAAEAFARACMEGR
ncbi:cobyrinate a,c-diamide synthase [Solidesulfovibrio sp.]|uniref:cobyrinate a,c-diamide synthase n=1 Tax=Solidesulfovibrio sp. TaxID=2910990 RepID=UPI00262F53ED|nr:cobyrinate a,c-diamide synthase [Solidesulfovibrio sp.]